MTTRNSSCNCGSGKRFKHCCGAYGAALDSNRSSALTNPSYTAAGWFSPDLRGDPMAAFCPPATGRSLIPSEAAPPGVLIVPNFLNASTCAEWCEYFRSQERMPLEVQNIDAYEHNREIAFEHSEGRITEAVDYRGLKSEVVGEVARGFSECVMPYFNTQLAAFEKPTVLRYLPGGKYDAHSDNELWDSTIGKWKKTLNRDFSILIYLNNEYDGGKLAFPNFLCKVAPSTGLLVAFPSDHRYLHAAEPVISGERYALVSWAARTKSV